MERNRLEEFVEESNEIHITAQLSAWMPPCTAAAGTKIPESFTFLRITVDVLKL